MSLQEIEDFLTQHTQEGEFDSHGSFRLDDSRSLSKLAEYQSERPGLWMAKLLQAAVALSSPILKVGQLLTGTVVSFCPAGLTSAQVSQALGSHEPSPHPGLRHLQVALQTLCSIPNQSAELYLDRQSFPLARGLIQGRPTDLTAPVVSIRVHQRRKFSLSLLERVRRSRTYINESLFLQELGRFAPLSLFIDGRIVNDPVINKPPGLRLGVNVPSLVRRPWPAIPYTAGERLVLTGEPMSARMGLTDHSLRLPVYLKIGSVESRPDGKNLYLQEWVQDGRGEPLDWLTSRSRLRSGLPQTRLSYPRFTSRIERNDGLFEIWPDYNRDLPTISLRGYLSLDINQGREGRLYLIKDGLLMKPKILPDPFFECLILWSAPQLRTDLSQLNVVEDEVYREVWDEICTHLAQTAASLLNSPARTSQQHSVINEARNRAEQIVKQLPP